VIYFGRCFESYHDYFLSLPSQHFIKMVVEQRLEPTR